MPGKGIKIIVNMSMQIARITKNIIKCDKAKTNQKVIVENLPPKSV